jgi:hypothetical protein
MKKWLFLTFGVLTTQLGFSQSALIPFMGVDFITLRPQEPVFGVIAFDFTEGFMNTGSFSFGLKGEHYVANDLIVSVSFSYTKKNISSQVFNSLPINAIQFNYFQNRLSLKYSLNNNFYAGAGGNINLLTDFQYLIRGKKIGQFISRITDFGISGCFGWTFKNINSEVYYFHSIKSHEDRSGLRIKPIQSFGLNVGYKFKI